MNVKSDQAILRKIEALPEPRHLFVLPEWLDPATLDRLIAQGNLTCSHQQRSAHGAILVAMGLELTAKGKRLIQHHKEWPVLALKGSLAGASFAAMSVVILYLG